jgi:hypothetical protein
MNIDRYEKTLNESSIQQEKHLPLGDPGDERNILYSIHQRGKKKTLWYNSSWETMEANSVPTNKERVTYKSKIYPYHALHRAVMSTVLPEIKVKDGEDVTIEWCCDLFVNLIKEYRIMFNDTELEYGNSKLLLAELDSLSMTTTCTGELQHLKETQVSMRMPFSYDRDPSDAFPLSLCGQNDRLHHVFEFNLGIENLIVMRDTDGQIVDFDMSKIEVTNNVDHIPVPELEGLYTTHTNKECDLSNCKENEVDGVREYFVQNIYYFEDDNEIPLGKRVQLKFDSKTNYPIEEMTWGAINVTMSDKEKNLIITTRDMTTPIKNTKLETSISTIIDGKSSFKTEYVYLDDCKRHRVGLNRWKNSICDSDGKKFIPGINFAGGKLTVNTISENHNCKFMVFVLMYHTRRFLFKTYPTTQQERLVKGATIELVNE